MSIRTDNLNVQSLLARAQSRLNSSTTAQTASDSAIKKSDAQAGATKTDSTKTETTEAEKVRKLAPSLSKAHERIAAQAQAGSTSLSALGQFKSSLVDLATAGKEMAALTATSTTQSVQGALEKLVARYNASAAAGSTTDVGATRALRELRAAIMSVTGSATSPSLARIGIVQRQDGTLAVDAKALEKSMATDPAGVTSALAGIGKAVENSANDALSTGSRLSSSMASLGDRVKALQQQQSAVVATAEKLGDSLVGSANWNRMVLDAYLKN